MVVVVDDPGVVGGVGACVTGGCVGRCRRRRGPFDRLGQHQRRCRRDERPGRVHRELPRAAARVGERHAVVAGRRFLHRDGPERSGAAALDGERDPVGLVAVRPHRVHSQERLEWAGRARGEDAHVDDAAVCERRRRGGDDERHRHDGDCEGCRHAAGTGGGDTPASRSCDSRAQPVNVGDTTTGVAGVGSTGVTGTGAATVRTSPVASSLTAPGGIVPW